MKKKVIFGIFSVLDVVFCVANIFLYLLVNFLTKKHNYVDDVDEELILVFSVLVYFIVTVFLIRIFDLVEFFKSFFFKKQSKEK